MAPEGKSPVTFNGVLVDTLRGAGFCFMKTVVEKSKKIAKKNV